MWPKRHAELLRGEVEALLAPLSDIADFHNLVREPLTRVRQVLATEKGHHRPWALLPLIVCEVNSGNYEHALPVAAALQLLIAAGDVFDDIEDADSPESLSARYGSAVATNVATTLISLAERAITRLQGRGVADAIIVRVADAVNSFYTTACIGQHLDLSVSSKKTVSEDMCIRVAHMKSASTVECACYIGALLATTNQELIDTFAEFGHNLGMASQIANDIRGITHGSDIAKHKITLPVIYALTEADGEAHNKLELAFGKQSESVPDPAQIRDLLFHTGAVQYATIQMELYKQRALNMLSEAERAGVNVERLKLFLG